jgi:tetratricopeptide (TPR) repeat protein
VVYSAEALQVVEAVDRPYDRLVVDVRVGHLHVRQGALHQAIPRLERAVALSREVDIPLFYRQAAAHLALAYALAGREAETLAVLGQVGGNMQYGPNIAHVCGEAYLYAGDVEEAYQLVQPAFANAHHRKRRGHEAWALRLLGEIAVRREPPAVAEAAAHYQQALALAEELGMRPLQAHCHRGLGTLYSQMGQIEQAHAALSTAIEMYRDMEMTFWLPETEAALAEVEKR